MLVNEDVQNGVVLPQNELDPDKLLLKFDGKYDEVKFMEIHGLQDEEDYQK